MSRFPVDTPVMHLSCFGAFLMPCLCLWSIYAKVAMVTAVMGTNRWFKQDSVYLGSLISLISTHTETKHTAMHFFIPTSSAFFSLLNGCWIGHLLFLVIAGFSLISVSGC